MYNLVECSKRPVQQGHRRLGTRCVHSVREHDKAPRTPLADFFNILLVAMTITLMGMPMLQFFFRRIPHTHNFNIKIEHDIG